MRFFRVILAHFCAFEVGGFILWSSFAFIEEGPPDLVHVMYLWAAFQPFVVIFALLSFPVGLLVRLVAESFSKQPMFNALAAGVGVGALAAIFLVDGADVPFSETLLGILACFSAGLAGGLTWWIVEFGGSKPMTTGGET